jgi:hypothetical protein
LVGLEQPWGRVIIHDNKGFINDPNSYTRFLSDDN